MLRDDLKTRLRAGAVAVKVERKQAESTAAVDPGSTAEVSIDGSQKRPLRKLERMNPINGGPRVKRRSVYDERFWHGRVWAVTQ